MCVWCAGTFLREALEKVGVDPNIIRIGKYKSAGELVVCMGTFCSSQSCLYSLGACDASARFQGVSAETVRMHKACEWIGWVTRFLSFSCLCLVPGDQLLRKDMSEAQREQLTAILDDIYEGFTQGIALSRGKSVQEVRVMVDSKNDSDESSKLLPCTGSRHRYGCNVSAVLLSSLFAGSDMPKPGAV